MRRPFVVRIVATVTIRAVRAILRLYPARFRARFGVDVLESVRGDLGRAAAGGRAAVLRAGAHAAGDALAGLIPEHRSARRRARRDAPAGSGSGVALARQALGVDLRDAIRSLRQSPTFTAVALVVLGLAIGAGTAIFSVVDAVVLRGLPFDRHDRVVAVLEYDAARPTALGGSTLPQNYLDWRARQRSFEHLAGTNTQRLRLRNANDEPAVARGLRVSWEFFPTLRVQPARGRAFGPADEVYGQHHHAILSYEFWQRSFGGADIIGQTIEINEERWEVAGVMPQGFSYPVASALATEIFLPLAFTEAGRARAGGRDFQYSVIGRLKDEISTGQAADEMSRVNVAINAEHPGWNSLNPGGGVRVITLHDRLVGRVRTWMLMLLGAVTLVLLIACANVANLMLARATVRGREMGIRAALGASGWRLTRALLVEGIVLSLAAAVIGVALAYGGVAILKAWMPAGIPRVTSIAIDLRVLGATIAAAFVTGVLFGIVPAFQGARPDLTTTLREGGRASSQGAQNQRLRSVLVVAEMALAVILVVGAGLFVGSFAKLMRVDPGFDYRGVLAVGVGISIPPAGFDDALERGRPYVLQMLEAVRAVPGVERAEAVSGGLPLSGGRVTNSVAVPGRGTLTGHADEIDVRWVTPGYLQLLRIPLRRGRYLTNEDRDGAPNVVVINEAAARTYWPGVDPLGQQMTIEKRAMTVVGVVGDIRHGGPETPPRQEGYIPLAQDRIISATLAMRTVGEPTALLPAVRAAIWSVNRDQRLTDVTPTLDGYMDALIAQRRFNMALLTLFGVLGLVIAAVGLYGVMAFVVAQRVSEIGVRMALGATPNQVMSLVLRQAGVLIALGLVIGGIGALNLGAVVRTFLFQIEPNDVGIFVAAMLTLAVAGLIASAIPARRASRVDPLTALRG